MLQIASYHIYGLHDVFTYNLPVDGRFDDVIIFYGKNGSGKTTLLKLLFHMLSPAGNKGHRTAISQVPFRRIRIELTDGTKITATRKKALSFPVEYRISRPNKKTIEWHYYSQSEREAYLRDRYIHDLYIANDRLEAHWDKADYRVIASKREAVEHASSEAQAAFYEALTDLNIGIYLITADRRIISDLLEQPADAEIGRRTNELSKDPIAIARAKYLNAALLYATRWVGDQLIAAANIGSKNSNEIYSDIVLQLAQANLQGDLLSKEQLSELIQELRTLRIRNRGFANFGLMPRLEVSKMVKALGGADDLNMAAVKMVVTPYISSLKARLDALTPIYNSINTFTRSLNEFFSYKRISFHTSKGFEIINDWGQTLTAEQLSSGEQQLLLIFCYALAAGDKKSVLIIDEPEISLNVEWQRKLIDSLRRVTEGSRNQLVFATHSIELLTQYMENVHQLEPVEIPDNDPVYEHSTSDN